MSVCGGNLPPFTFTDARFTGCVCSLPSGVVGEPTVSRLPAMTPSTLKTPISPGCIHSSAVRRALHRWLQALQARGVEVRPPASPGLSFLICELGQ